MRTVRYCLAVALLLAPFAAQAQPIPAYGTRQPLYPARALPAPTVQPASPHYAPMVLPSGDVVEMEAPAAPVESSAEPEYVPQEVTWGGSVEAGLRYTTGNTESRHLNAAGSITRDSAKWLHTLDGKVSSIEEDGEKTAEEYRLGFDSQYKLTQRSFLFGEADYVDDQFSGYDYRISEVLGVGYHWYDDEDFRWNSKAGAGFQHTKTTDGVTDDSPLARFENILFWQMLERLAFENLVRLDVSDFMTTYTESSLKTEVSDGLYVKFSVVTEHLSEVPSGTDKLDIDTLINLAYEY